MSSRARTRTTEAMISASSLCMVVAGMSIISPDVRPHVVNALGDPAGQLSAMASRALEYGHMLARVTRDYGVDNTALAGFGIVAVILTVMMFRS